MTGLLAHVLDRRLRLLGEVRLAPVEVVEAPGDLAGELHVRDLVLADRDETGLVDQDVGGLQERIAEEAVGREVAVLEPFLLLLVGGDTLQPTERGEHGQQEVQLGVLRHPGLHEHPREAGVDARGEPVDHHLPHVVGDGPGLVVVRGERVPVGDEEEALVLLLQAQPVLQDAVVVAQVQGAGRAHAREHTLVLGCDACHG